MKAWIQSIVNFYIYSSIHISIVATLFCAETYFYVCHELDLMYLGLVFSSTLLVYSLHRIIGISKIKSDLIQGRYEVILRYKSHLKVYAAIALIGLLFFVVLSPMSYLYFLIPLGFISLLYTLPLLSNNNRLRDINYIKIFLIAIVWAGVTISPVIISDQPVDIFVLSLLSIEKLIYIIAITLPFDIRDIRIDTSLVTKTIPQVIGVSKTYIFIGTLVLIGFLLYACSAFISNLSSVIPYIIAAYLLSIIALYVSKGKKSDYYYSGLLDGVIGVRSLIIIVGCLS